MKNVHVHRIVLISRFNLQNSFIFDSHFFRKYFHSIVKNCVPTNKQTIQYGWAKGDTNIFEALIDIDIFICILNLSSHLNKNNFIHIYME